MSPYNHLACATDKICTRNIYKTDATMIVKSKITDIDTGLPIPSVNVYLKNNPTVGTITDANGEFTLNANPTDEIVISHVVYGAIEIPAQDIEGNEYLQEQINTLNEVDLGNIGTKPKLQTAGFGLLALLLLLGLVLGSKKDDKKTVKASV